MEQSIYDKVVIALRQAEKHNSTIMISPEVILWPDPEKQWGEIIPDLQDEMPQLISYGKYDPNLKQGPAIWIKSMVAGTLPEATWGEGVIPVIYLPGVSKSDLRNVEKANLQFQPLIEYQYTGTMFVQENGREWTILAFMENPVHGLGLKVAKDDATREALKKALPQIFRDSQLFKGKTFIDVDFLNSQLFPDIIHHILKWMCRGDQLITEMEPAKRELFINICKSRYDFIPDYRNIFPITEKLGAQRNQWKNVWQMYANAPLRYPELEALLRSSKPDDLGEGVFAIPEESWPQVNEEMENKLRQALEKIAGMLPDKALAKLRDLQEKHRHRTVWVWTELGYSPLLNALPYLIEMAEISMEAVPSQSVEVVKEYYIMEGYKADQYMRKALAAVDSEKDKNIVVSLVRLLYAPWLELLAERFQSLIQKDPSIFISQARPTDDEVFVLFVDALRYELAREFEERLAKSGYKVDLTTMWSAIPSVTSTAKPAVSPLANEVSNTSRFTEFRPELKSERELTSAVFKESLGLVGFSSFKSDDNIDSNIKYWQETGDIDKKGHDEQAGVVRRVEELFNLLLDIVNSAFEKGTRRIRMVTDHGWLLLPGGLPKTKLYEGLTETRWGRCAVIKEGVKTDLLQLPWRWNPDIFIAYAPGTTFFRANQEYAHGGISLQECLVPVLTVERLEETSLPPKITGTKWVNLKCAVETENTDTGYSIDIRTKFNDANTSIVISRNRAIIDNQSSVMVNDEAEAQAATIVLLDDKERIRDKKATTVGE